MGENPTHPVAAEFLKDAAVRNRLSDHWRESYVCEASGYQFLRLFLTTAHPAPGRCDH
jgi:hypothetical protein